jgi:hypothetical protein
MTHSFQPEEFVQRFKREKDRFSANQGTDA